MSWLAGVPVLIALPLFGLIPAALAVGVHTLVRRRVPPESLAEQHDVPGFLISVVGVLYSVVLGFLVGTVWTQFASAQQTADSEAGAVADAFNYAANVGQPQSALLQRLIARYAIEVHDVEWFSSRSGREDVTAPSLLVRAVRVALTLPLSSQRVGAAVLQRATIRDWLLGSLRDVANARRLRLVQSQSWLPPGLLEALILGGVVVICFTFFFGVKNYRRQMLMTALLAGSMGLFFGLVIELSTPYSGAIHISRDAWTYIIDNNDLTKYAR
ncbi:MAG TPA: hypothetical protein VHT92_11605 [Candidatus Cybelea sp.]|nr:hypothetical protein [Candidatus Cybelea sp.]